MSKLKKLKDFIEDKYYDPDTGVSLNFEELRNMIKSCEDYDRKKKYREGLVKLRNQRGKKIIDRRIYKMDFMFENDNNLELSPDAYYCYGRLKDNLMADNTCRCYIEGVNSVSTLSKFIKISRQRTTKAIKELQEKNIIQITKSGNYSEFFINPMYCRFGTRVQDTAIELFGLDENMFEE